jgi:hypothetical protein
VGDTSTFVEVSSSWQLCDPLMTTDPITGPDTDGQYRDAEIVADPVRDHAPGPRRGTTATEKPGVSVPASTPLAALTLGARAGDLTLESIAATDGRTVVVVAVGRVVVAVGRVVVVAGLVDVVVAGLVVGAVDASAVVVTKGAGAGARADTVNSSTRSRRGLDHARTWAPGRE